MLVKVCMPVNKFPKLPVGVGRLKVSKKELRDYLKNHSRRETRSHFNLSYNSFISHLRLYKMENFGIRARSRPKKELPPKEEVAAYYRDHTIGQCKKHFGLGQDVMIRCLETYGLRDRVFKIIVPIPPRETLFNYLQTHSTEETAEYYGVDPSVILKWTRHYGIGKNPVNTLGFSEAAKYLGVSRQAITQWDDKGVIRGVKSRGRLKYIPVEEVERLKGERFNCTKKGGEKNTPKE